MPQPDNEVSMVKAKHSDSPEQPAMVEASGVKLVESSGSSAGSSAEVGSGAWLSLVARKLIPKVPEKMVRMTRGNKSCR